MILVVNLQSENAPAPPSPNWTLDSVFNSPVYQNLSTVSVLLSTSSPRSITSGLYPFSANSNAANIPAGPNPTTTGLFFNYLSPETISAL